MAKPAPGQQSKQNVEQYNLGYADGYHDNPIKQDQTTFYLRGYSAGAMTKLEDEEAMLSGQFDNLSESERLYLYGNENP